MKKIYQVFDKFNDPIASFDNEEAAIMFCDKIWNNDIIREIELLSDCPKDIVYKVSFECGRCIDIESIPFSSLEEFVDYSYIEDDYYELYVLAENMEKAKEYGKRKLEEARKIPRA